MWKKMRRAIRITYLLLTCAAAALTTRIQLHHHAPFNSGPDAARFVAVSAPNFGAQRKGMRFRKRPLFTFVQNTVTHGYVTHLLLGQKLPENHAGVLTAKCNRMHVKCILHFIYFSLGHTKCFSGMLNSRVVWASEHRTGVPVSYKWETRKTA